MKIWLIQKGFEALQRGEMRVFIKMLGVLILIGTSAVVEVACYYTWRVQRVFAHSKTIVINGSKMLTLSGDRGISRELAVFGVREKFVTKYVQKTVGKNFNCIDIGANLGYYTLLEARRAREGTIYAFEPDRGNFLVLQSNVLMNNAVNVVLSDRAVARERGAKDFYLYPKRNWSSFNDRIGYRYFDRVRVEAVSLDCIYKNINRPLNLVRMDVEGYEAQIISGAKKLLRESEKLTLIIEIHPHLSPKKDLQTMLATLQKSGFFIEAIMLEPLPRFYRYLEYINSYRRSVGVLPYGRLRKKYCRYDFLEKMLFSRERGFNYYPHVVFGKSKDKK